MTQLAVCKCKDMSETNLVLAVKKPKFNWLEITIYILIIVFGNIFGFIGVLLWVIFWNLVSSEKQMCQFCKTTIKTKQYRAAPQNLQVATEA